MMAHYGYVMTLANSIIGVGILAMPFCFQKCGVILAILLLILSNWITCICCHYLIKSSLLTRRKSIEFLGFHAFGSSGKLLVELCIIGYLLGTCITYFVVIGDLGPQIITKMFDLQQQQHNHLRTILMIAVTLFCILPLGMLRNVDSLSTVCTASIGFYACLVLKIMLESKTHITAFDWPDKLSYWQPNGILQCLPIFSMALSCQMQLFEVFTSINNQSVEKLNGIVYHATWICTMAYIAVGFFGYVAFCSQTFSGNILVNLSSSFGSDAIKIGFVLSVAFSFPLVIFPCRASLYSLLYRKGQADSSGYIPETRFKVITIFIVVFSLCIALVIPSVELIIGLVGSTIGVAICIMFPAACYRKIITKKNSMERNIAQLILLGGFCLMILGTYANLHAIDEKNSGAHLDKSQGNSNPIPPQPTNTPNLLVAIKKRKFEDSIAVKYENKPQQLHASSSSSSSVLISPPPLPIDGAHSDEVNQRNQHDEQMKRKLEVQQLPVKNTDLGEVNKFDLKEVAKQQQNSADNNKDIVKNGDKIQLQQNNENKADLNVNEETLKETKIELEKTKDLLEKRVEELQKQLIKQNQETQNMVAEKLSEVVEKFQQIERKVEQNHNKQQEEQQEIETDKHLKNPIMLNASHLAKDNQPPLKRLMTNLSINNEKPNKTVGAVPTLNGSEIVEKNMKNDNEIQRLPLPLALLINSSQANVPDVMIANGVISRNVPAPSLNSTNATEHLPILIAKAEEVAVQERAKQKTNNTLKQYNYKNSNDDNDNNSLTINSNHHDKTNDDKDLYKIREILQLKSVKDNDSFHGITLKTR